MRQSPDRISGSRVVFAQRSPAKSEESTPLVSFVVPVLNGERTLDRCLGSIRMQKNCRTEIIVVDNGSKDRSVEIAKSWGAMVLRKMGPLGLVRQTGYDASRGELVAMWDADLYIPRGDWLEGAIRTLLDYEGASTLWVLTDCPANNPGLSVAHNWLSWRLMLPQAKRGVGFWGGGASIFKRSALKQIGGVEVKIDTGEDYAMARALALKGYEVVFYPDAILHDSHRSGREIIAKEARRARNFRKEGLGDLTGVPLRIFLLEHMRNGFFPPELARKDPKAALVIPLLVYARLVVYLTTFLRSRG